MLALPAFLRTWRKYRPLLIALPHSSSAHFAALNGPAFYRLPVNTDTITLLREDVTVPEVIDCAGTPIVPFHAGETLRWKLA